MPDGTVPRTTYSLNVFVNCPFDSEYEAMMEALVFVVHDCGFIARSALEVDDAGQVRFEKIADIIRNCRLGIHDLSRTELDAGSGLPRFNMPLELGLFLGAKKFGSGKQKEKLCLILDCEKFRYQQFCSDIAGQDIRSHEREPARAIRIARDWLRNASLSSGVIIPSGARMVDRYRAFQAELPLLCERLQLDRDDLIFNDYTTLIAEWLKVNNW
jgi:hypothetical protein